ncbi:MAG: glycosyl transferase group 1 [Flaviaesturariibacter sp.]|nr:glycosyl transferase group 1 [Flaviaesturariibacter sp.]
MVILHVVEPFAAGIAVFVRSLTEAMPNDTHIIFHGERKNVMSAKEVKSLFPERNVRFIRWQSAQRSINPLKDLQAFNQLYRLLKRLKTKGLIDAVHLHSSKSGLIGRVACRMAGITNVIYTPNGAPFLSGSNHVANYFYRRLEKFGNIMGGEIVCCSESELEAYKKIGLSGRFINNGVSIQPLAPGLRQKDFSKFRIVTSGRIEAQKNPALFNSVAGYFEELDQFEFIWIGDGAEKDLLTAKNITVTGWIDPAEVKTLMASADMYFSTSVYEGLSFAALEALSLQKPLLLSDCVGNKDIISKGLNGDLFGNKNEAVNKILSYYNNSDMLRVMGQTSYALCQKQFDMKQNFGSYRRIYSNESVKKDPSTWSAN